MILVIFQTFVYYKFDYIFFYSNLAHLKAQYISHHVSFDPPYNTAQHICTLVLYLDLSSIHQSEIK